MSTTAPVEIVPYRPELAAPFQALNRAWIERYVAIEPADLKTLEDPAPPQSQNRRTNRLSA